MPTVDAYIHLDSDSSFILANLRLCKLCVCAACARRKYMCAACTPATATKAHSTEDRAFSLFQLWNYQLKNVHHLITSDNFPFVRRHSICCPRSSMSCMRCDASAEYSNRMSKPNGYYISLPAISVVRLTLRAPTLSLAIHERAFE